MSVQLLLVRIPYNLTSAVGQLLGWTFPLDSLCSSPRWIQNGSLCSSSEFVRSSAPAPGLISVQLPGFGQGVFPQGGVQPDTLSKNLPLLYIPPKNCIFCIRTLSKRLYTAIKLTDTKNKSVSAISKKIVLYLLYFGLYMGLFLWALIARQAGYTFFQNVSGLCFTRIRFGACRIRFGLKWIRFKKCVSGNLSLYIAKKTIKGYKRYTFSRGLYKTQRIQNTKRARRAVCRTCSHIPCGCNYLGKALAISSVVVLQLSLKPRFFLVFLVNAVPISEILSPRLSRSSRRSRSNTLPG